MDFEEYWADLREGLGERKDFDAEVLSLPALHRWAQDIHNPSRPPLVVISGSRREVIYDRFQSEDQMFAEPGLVHDLGRTVTDEWIKDGLAKHITNRVRDIEIPPEFRAKQNFMFSLPTSDENARGWEILWGLVSVSFLTIEEPLARLIDQRLSLLSGVYRSIMEARFEALEFLSNTHQVGVPAIGRWVEGDTLTSQEKAFLQRAGVKQEISESARFEVLLFLLALARQNGVVGGVVLALDGLEQVTDKARADELFRLIEITEKWTKLGAPLGILLGWRGTKEDLKNLRKLHPRLAKKVAMADAWIRQACNGMQP